VLDDGHIAVASARFLAREQSRGPRTRRISWRLPWRLGSRAVCSYDGPTAQGCAVLRIHRGRVVQLSLRKEKPR
jgi:hypothetical protein